MHYAEYISKDYSIFRTFAVQYNEMGTSHTISEGGKKRTKKRRHAPERLDRDEPSPGSKKTPPI